MPRRASTQNLERKPRRQAEGLPELLVLEEPAWWIFVFTYWCAEEGCEKPLKSLYADEWAGSFDQRLWATERKGCYW
jgi:hypothetical protein